MTLPPSLRALGAAAVAAASAGLSELAKRFVGGMPRGLVIILLSGFALALLGYLIGHLWCCRRPALVAGPGGGPPDVPCYPLSVRAIGTVIAVLFAAFVVYLEGPEASRWVHAWAVLGRAEPPELELKLARAVLNVGDELEVQVLVNGKPAGASDLCEWAEGLARWYRGPGCVPRHRIPLDFVGEQEGRREVRVAVKVFDTQRRLLGAPPPTVVFVRYVPVVELNVSAQRVFAGQSATFRVSLNGRAPAPEYQCGWTVGQAFRGWQDCALDYTAPAQGMLGGTVARVAVRVTLVNPEKTEIGGAEGVIEIVQPLNYFVLAVDASDRTRALAGGTPLLDTLKLDLLSNLGFMNALGSHVGIEVFGAPTTLPPEQRCRNSVALVPLQPLKLEWVRERVEALVPGTPDAPLMLAVERALATLAPYRAEANARLHLVAITAGPDTCVDRDMAAAVARLREIVVAAGLQSAWFDYRLLTLTVGIPLSPQDLQQWRGWWTQPLSSEVPHVVIPAPDPVILQQIIEATGRLGAADYHARRTACEALMGILGQQQLDRGVRAMAQYCRRWYPDARVPPSLAK